MNEDAAIDAAVLVFIEKDESTPIKQRLREAVATYLHTSRVCPACAGEGSLTKRAGSLFLADGYGSNAKELMDGDDLDCVVCGGTGVDLTRVAWVCRVEYGHPCRPDLEADDKHATCEWALNIPMAK